MQNTVKIKCTCLLLCILLVVLVLLSLPLQNAFASSYSNVLYDLQKDSSFNTANYPAVDDNNSLQVIQIAESTDKQLFVYVYQPSANAKKLTASSINISLTPRQDISFINYKLTLVSSDGVFQKYLVNDLTVKSDSTRYYTITSIYRPFDSDIDDDADFDNEITEMEYTVAKEYCFGILNGEPFCRVLDIETIEITDKFVGFVRYTDGFNLYNSACDSHFVAFSTDRDIDRLLEADVYYTTQSYSVDVMPPAPRVETFGDITDRYAYLTYEQKVEHTGSGLFAPTYKWNRIETVDQFIAENNIEQDVYTGVVFNVGVVNKITDEGMQALKGKQWVLRFAETDYLRYSTGMSTNTSYTLVGNVTILRLKFETDGIVYNLGTIDNKQTGSDKPVNDETTIFEPKSPPWWVILIIVLVILVVLCILFNPVLTAVTYILKFVLWLIKQVFRILLLPFTLIANAVKARKNKTSKEVKTK